MNHRPIWLLAVAASCCAVSEAVAEEPKLAEARQIMDAVEAGIGKLAPGDTAAANALIAKINAANQLLAACSNKGAPEWKAQAERWNTLAPRVQARHAGQAGGDPGAEEAAVTQARRDIDAIEAELAKMQPGDAAKANELIGKCGAVVKLLRTCKNQQAPAWGAQARRCNELDGKIRARHAGQGGATPAGPDEATLEAVKILGEVEAAVDGLKAGDIEQANQLIKRINASRDCLSRSNRRQTEEWQTSARRADALDKLVRDMASGRSSYMPGDPGLMPKDGPPLSTNDDYAFRRDFLERYPDYEKTMLRVDARVLADAYQYGKLKGAAETMRKALARLDPSHPKVKWANAKLDAYLQGLEKRAQEGRKLVAEAQASAQAEADAVEKELREIEDFFDPRSFRCDLEPPYTPERVTEWVALLKRYEGLGAKGLAHADRVAKEHPAYAEHPRLRSVRHIFREVLPRKLREGIDKTTDWFSVGANSRQIGEWPGRIKDAQRLCEPGAFTEARLADEGWVSASDQALRDGIEAAQAMALFQKLYHEKPDAESAQLVKEFAAAIGRLEAAARKVLEGQRMPKADSESQELHKIANEVLANPKVGAGKSLRQVINSDKRHEEEWQREAWVDGPMIRIKTWLQVWDQFQVCRAEEVDGQVHLVYYGIKFIHQGTGPTGRWYCCQRLVSRRILPENVQK